MLQRFVKHGLVGALLLTPLRAWAQDTSVPPPADPPKEEPKKEEAVVVRGRAPTPSRGASDFNLRIGELANVPRSEGAAGLLKLAPGILLTNKGGDGHAEQIFLRGFDAREGQDVELTAAGVPINEAGNLHGNGYADLHFIIPELVESLRVIEGPFDPRQGNFAVAGSAAYELGLVRRGLTAKYTTGSFGTRRMLVMWGPGGHSTRTFGGAELFDTDGFGENRSARRGSAMAQYEGALGAVQERGRRSRRRRRPQARRLLRNL
jgi:iron complex outermembrane receptor protein